MGYLRADPKQNAVLFAGKAGFKNLKEYKGQTEDLQNLVN